MKSAVDRIFHAILCFPAHFLWEDSLWEPPPTNTPLQPSAPGKKDEKRQGKAPVNSLSRPRAHVCVCVCVVVDRAAAAGFSLMLDFHRTLCCFSPQILPRFSQPTCSIRTHERTSTHLLTQAVLIFPFHTTSSPSSSTTGCRLVKKALCAKNYVIFMDQDLECGNEIRWAVCFYFANQL